MWFSTSLPKSGCKKEIDDEMLIAAIIESDIQLDDAIDENETDAIIEYLSTEEIDLIDMLIE